MLTGSSSPVPRTLHSAGTAPASIASFLQHISQLVEKLSQLKRQSKNGGQHYSLVGCLQFCK